MAGEAGNKSDIVTMSWWLPESKPLALIHLFCTPGQMSTQTNGPRTTVYLDIQPRTNIGATSLAVAMTAVFEVIKRDEGCLCECVSGSI